MQLTYGQRLLRQMFAATDDLGVEMNRDINRFKRHLTQPDGQNGGRIVTRPKVGTIRVMRHRKAR